MQPHSCAALTVFAYLHMDLVRANQLNVSLDKSQFRFKTFDIRVQTPSLRQKIYSVEVELYSRSQNELRLTIGKDYPCRLRIGYINYAADECQFVHDHPTIAYSQEVFRLFPSSSRAEARFRVPLPVYIGVVDHDVVIDMLGDMHKKPVEVENGVVKKISSSSFELSLYDTRSNETDPVRRRYYQYHTWVLGAY